MRVAIVAPGSVPYTIGGAEKLWWGLVDHINSMGSWDAELVKLRSPERTFPELMRSYRQFSELDLSKFDRIISTKYPAWMVDHPDHLVYMQHKLRGLYDAYHFCGKPERLDPVALKSAPAALQSLVELSQRSKLGREILPEFWSKLDAGLAVAPEWFEFPGPLTRQLVHFLDSIGLRQRAISRYCAISRNVAGRKDYFPLGVVPEVVHHPSDLPAFANTGADYVFTISRLDGPKRIDLLLDAFMKTTDDVEFRIAGEGPAEEALKRQAAGDPRVRFLGRISDAETIKQYAGAIFIPFIPYDEDYGLITYEAMCSEKAVLTTLDSGGPNELVEHGVNGLVVAAEAQPLADAMSRLLVNQEQTAQWGRQASLAVRHISWHNTVVALLEQPRRVVAGAAPSDNRVDYTAFVEQQSSGCARNRAGTRQHWLVTTTFPVWPPRGGGQSRIFNLYREVARYHDVTLLCYTEAGGFYLRQQIAPGLVEVRVPRSQVHHHDDVNLHKSLGVSVDDISVISHFQATPHYLEELKRLSAPADVVIVSHPYTFPALRSVYRGPFWYEAHNVEYDMKAAILPDSREGRYWLEQVRLTESTCYQQASRILFCSEQDQVRFSSLYGGPPMSAHIVPNGVVVHSTFDELSARKPHLRARMGLPDQCVALFIGSWHGPNIQAVEWIIENASALREVQFLLVGSVCSHPVCNDLPANVHAIGVLDEPQKNLLVEAVDIAINPVVSGSGTNLKMLDYAIAATPILTTPFGNRGMPFAETKSCVISELEGFADALKRCSRVVAGPDSANQCRVAYGQALDYEWRAVCARLLTEIKEK